MSNGGYSKPNYTQIPNAFFDVHLPRMKEAELRVVLAIARATFGWHKEKDKLSLTQLMEKTGLKRQGVINGIQDGMKHGLITREESGMGFLYSLVINDELVNEVDQLDQSTKETSPLSRPQLVNEVDQLDDKLVNEVDTQKKVTTKESKKKTTIVASGASESETPAGWSEVVSAYESNIGMFTAMTSDMVKEAIIDYGSVQVVDAIKEAVKNNVRKWSYVEGILKRWKANGKVAKTITPQMKDEWLLVNNQYDGTKYWQHTSTGEKKPYVNT